MTLVIFDPDAEVEFFGYQGALFILTRYYNLRSGTG